MNETTSAVQREIRQTRPFHSRAQEATIAILRTADVLRRRLGAVIEPHGITLQQFNVLRILRGAQGKPMPTLEIGGRLIEQTPGITRLLDRLEEKELVRRARCTEDRRQVHCFITPAGLELLDHLEAPMAEGDDLPGRVLGDEELARLIDYLDRIRDAE
ncbi:MAG TPA: MarR family transcriptional regulator [Longimicrobium sp.]|jgi:DNA-binding MarR family transcriptional regulator